MNLPALLENSTISAKILKMACPVEDLHEPENQYQGLIFCQPYWFLPSWQSWLGTSYRYSRNCDLSFSDMSFGRARSRVSFNEFHLVPNQSRHPWCIFWGSGVPGSLAASTLIGQFQWIPPSPKSIPAPLMYLLRFWRAWGFSGRHVHRPKSSKNFLKNFFKKMSLS